MVDFLGILSLLTLGLTLVLGVAEIVFILYSGNAVIFRLGPLLGKSVFELSEEQLNKINASWQILGDSENVRCGRVISQLLLVRLFAYKKNELDDEWTVECRGPLFLWLIHPTFMLFAILNHLNGAKEDSLYVILGLFAFIGVYQIQIKMQVVKQLKSLVA
jgi:hypothetical protein